MNLAPAIVLTWLLLIVAALHCVLGRDGDDRGRPGVLS